MKRTGGDKRHETPMRWPFQMHFAMVQILTRSPERTIFLGRRWHITQYMLLQDHPEQGSPYTPTDLT